MFTKREIIELFNEAEIDDINKAVNYILTKLNLTVADVIHTKKYDLLKVAVKTLKSKFKLKWEASRRTLNRFEAKNAVWLESEFQIPNFSCLESEKHSKPGRSNVAFDQKSQRLKRRDVAAISNQNENNPQKILMACRHAARLSGEKDLFAIL